MSSSAVIFWILHRTSKSRGTPLDLLSSVCISGPMTNCESVLCVTQILCEVAMCPVSQIGDNLFLMLRKAVSAATREVWTVNVFLSGTRNSKNIFAANFTDFVFLLNLHRIWHRLYGGCLCRRSSWRDISIKHDDGRVELDVHVELLLPLVFAYLNWWEFTALLRWRDGHGLCLPPSLQPATRWCPSRILWCYNSCLSNRQGQEGALGFAICQPL